MISDLYGWLESMHCVIDGHIHKKTGRVPMQRDNQIFYTTTDGAIYDMEEAMRAMKATHPSASFAINLVSNVYRDGVGIMTFDSDVEALGLTGSKDTEGFIYPTFNVMSMEDPESTFVDNIKTVTLPSCLDSICTYAFQGCSYLTELVIPKYVTYIEASAFTSLSALQAIVVEEGNEFYDSRNGCNALIDTNTNSLIRGCINTVIPNDVEYICNNAFTHCHGLEEIAIPDSVCDIGEYAFSYCGELKSCVLPSELAKISDGLFWYCMGLNSVTLPAGIEVIGKNVFYDCLSLKSLVFEGSMSEWSAIDKDAMWNNSSEIEKIICNDGEIIL